ncbi:MAG: acetolactate synthase catalytic subunit [Rhizomicrobium sp.]
MITSEALAVGLARHGVEVTFSQCFPVRTQHVAPKYGIRQIGFRTENAGGAMADGYARVARRIAVLAAQSGPAATLLVPPLAEAFKASTPILALIEESAHAEADRNAFQEFDHFALFSSCSKWTRRVDRTDRLDDYLDMAIVQATSGRPGPVVLILPSDFMGEQAVPSKKRTVKLGHYPLDRVVPTRDRIREAASALASAQRPLIIAGGGVHSSDAAAEVVKLCELGAIPVATTNMGKGTIDERSPLSLGVFGNCMGHGARAQHLRSYASDADLVLLVGTRTNANGTANWTLFPPDTRFIHIDIDSFEIGRNYEAMRLAGDAKATLAAILDELTEQDFPNRSTNLERIAKSTAAAAAKSNAFLDEIGPGRQGAVRPEHLMRTLDPILRPQDIFVADASYSTNWASTFLSAKANGARFLTPRGLAGLGWGMPMAMGAKLARPEANVFALVGDGGFAHCWSELEAARRLIIKVVVIVLNNQILGYQKHGEEWFMHHHSDASDLGPVDHAAIARACDCFGERVASPQAFAPALERAIKDPRPAVLDVITDDTARPPLNQYLFRPGQNKAAPV